MFPKTKTNKKNKGFTLVEMIIVVAIIAIIAGGVIFSNYGMRAQREFENDYNKVIGTFQQARSMALSGQSYVDFADYDGDGDFDDLILPHGYIVRIFLSDSMPEAGLFQTAYAQDVPQNDPGEVVIELWADLYGTMLEEIDENDLLIRSTNLENLINFDFTKINFNGMQVEGEEGVVTLLYKTPDASFSLPDDFPGTSVEFKFIGKEERTRYIYLHHLSGIPEPSRESRLNENDQD